MDPLETFGRRLKTLRVRRGVTQRDLAEVAAIDHTYLSKLETGRGNPTLELMLRLCDGLDCDLRTLLKGLLL